jgi:multiple sugar transport system ATP-binding protein
LSVKADGLAKAAFGETLGLAIPPAACHLFDASGRTILNGDLTR